MLDRLRNNLGLKILSFAIAIVGWTYLRLTPNPVIAARFVQKVNVPIVTTGLRSEEVVHFTDRFADVSIDVPRAGPEIRAEMVRAVLDLEGRGPGVYNVPLEVIAPKLEIKSLSPASVTLTIERIEERSIPLSVRYTGVRRGIVVGTIALQPQTAHLHAPTSVLERVANVRVDVPFASAPATLDAMLRPIATDDRGNEIVGVTLSPNLTRVRARFVAATKGP